MIKGNSELRRIVIFAIVGFIAFLGYSASMWLVVNGLGGGQILGAFLGFIIGTSLSYIGNSLFVFKVVPESRSALRFWMVTLGGLCVNLAMAFTFERLGFPPLATVLVIFITVPALNYIGHRFWTFRGHSAV